MVVSAAFFALISISAVAGHNDSEKSHMAVAIRHRRTRTMADPLPRATIHDRSISGVFYGSGSSFCGCIRRIVSLLAD